MMDKLMMRAVSAPWHAGVDILVRTDKAVAVDVVMEDIREGVMMDRTFKIDRDMAQQLMDDLWITGLRPSEGTGSAGSLAATQEHLRDMRVIAFKKLGIEGYK